MKKDNKLLVLMIVGIVLVAGSAYLFWPERPESSAIVAGGEGPIVSETVNLEPTGTVLPLVNPSELNAVSETANEDSDGDNTSTVAVQPTPRSEMEGTNPNSVNLASGNFQLVELFAFW